MSFGELLLAFFVCLAAICIAAFVVLMTALIVEVTAEILDVRWQEVMAVIFVVLATAFFTWFVMGMPVPWDGGQSVPHAVEGREEWIDAREGTMYSQEERRTDD